MATNIDPRSVFPSYELLVPTGDPDSDTAAADNVVAATQATATATLNAGAVSAAIANPGTFYANTPSVTIDAPAAGNVPQVNSNVVLTFSGVAPNNGATITLDGNTITFGDHTTGANVVTDVVAISAVPAVQAELQIDLAGGYSVNDFKAAGAILAKNNETGVAGQAANQTFNGVATTSSASGLGVTCNVVVDGLGAATVTIVDPGSGHAVGDTLTIADTDLGNSGQDITFDVAGIETSPTTLTIEDFTQTGVNFVAGVDFDVNGANRATVLTNLVNAINNNVNFEAAAAGNGFLVKQATAGDDGNQSTSSVSGVSSASLVAAAANFGSGSDLIPGGTQTDDTAAAFEAYINSGAIANFSASRAGAVVTLEYTGNNGTDPAATPVGNTKTITSTIAGGKLTILNSAGVALTGNAFEDGTIATRAATATVTLNSSTDAALRGTVASISITDGGSGYAAVPAITIDAPAGNVIDLIAKEGAQVAVGANTFAYNKKYLAIAIEDVIVGSGNNSQAFTDTEAAKTSGDMRKLAYHLIRQYYDYLDVQNGISRVIISNGGSGYAVGDIVNINGGKEAVPFTVAEIDSGQGTGAGVITRLENNSLDYSSAAHGNPAIGEGFTNLNVSYAFAGQYNGTGCVLTIELTDNLPESFSMSRSAISENATTGVLTRTYNASFDFDETGLELTDEPS